MLPTLAWATLLAALWLALDPTAPPELSLIIAVAWLALGLATRLRRLR